MCRALGRRRWTFVTYGGADVTSTCCVGSNRPPVTLPERLPGLPGSGSDGAAATHTPAVVARKMPPNSVATSTMSL